MYVCVGDALELFQVWPTSRQREILRPLRCGPSVLAVARMARRGCGMDALQRLRRWTGVRRQPCEPFEDAWMDRPRFVGRLVCDGAAAGIPIDLPSWPVAL